MTLSRWIAVFVCAWASACGENAASTAATGPAGTSTAGAADAKVAVSADIGQPTDIAVPTACKVSADCGAPAACQTFVCDPKLGCVATTLPDGAVCTPADKCAQGGSCSGSTCTASKPKLCDDANPCTADQCSPAASGDGCMHSANAASCDDGDPCTDGDICKDSQCQAGATSVCGCKTSADCAAKEDGNLCNGTLYCDASKVCKVNPATIVACGESTDPCVVNACDGKSGKCGSVPAVDGTTCSDGKACTVGDVCTAGVCTAGTGVCCKDTADCAKADDGDLCNGTWFCNKASGACQFNPATVVKCATVDDTACSKSLCDGKSGVCAPVAIGDGKACDDGNPCTSGDACQAGQCASSANTCICKDDAECAGKDDGDLCNGLMYCNKASGKCEINPATVVVCQTALDTVCSKTACEAKTGVCKALLASDQTQCEADGNVCTVGDHCAQGQCVPGTDVCACKSDAECAGKEDGDLCNGTLFCNKTNGKCQLNPKTVVVCPTVGDSACKVNTCDALTGQCAFKNINQFQGCDADGLVCTLTDNCVDGVCKPGANVCECLQDSDCKDDGDLCNGTVYCDKSKPFHVCATKAGSVVQCAELGQPPCSTSKCQATTGKCVLAVGLVGLDCDDGTACTEGDSCAQGKCVPAGQVDCNDKQPCTNDSCNPVKGCVHLFNAATCSDGDPCTVGDKCSDGACTVGTPMNCNDGDACTLGDACKGGTCIVFGKNACSDGEPCTADACDAKTGLCSHQASLACLRSACLSKSDCAVGMVCDVGLASCVTCTDASHCGNGQACQGGMCVTGTACESFVPCKPLGMVCNNQTGSCVQCLQDGDCGDDKVCQGQRCAPKVSCKTDADCPAVCDLQKKVCADCNANGDCPGGACGADHMCRPGHTSAKQCAGGSLFTPMPGNQAYLPQQCGDDNPCTDGGCQLPSGCTLTVNSAPCDDGEVCSVGDTCKGGKCLAGSGNKCDDGKPCTTDKCDAITSACSHEPYEGPCSDGNACTTGEVCLGGVCKGGKVIVCDDGNVCTDDSCDAKVGCSFGVNSAACDAGACTTGDVCLGGMCVSSKQKVVWEAGLTGSKGSIVRGLAVNANGFYAVVSYGSAAQPNGGALLRLDGQGNVLWKVEPTLGAGCTPRAVAVVGEGVVVCGGALTTVQSNNYCIPWAARYDGEGKQVASYFGDPTYGGVLNAIAVVPGGIVAAGFQYNGGTTLDDGVIKLLDGGLKPLFSKLLSVSGTALSKSLNAVAGSGSDFVVAGWSSTSSSGTDGLVARYDATGKELWQRTFGGAGKDEFNAVAALGNGDIALAGSTGSKGAGGRDGWLLRLVAIGERADDRTFGTPGDEEFLAIADLGGTLALTGRTQGKGAATQGWILSVDYWGNTAWQRKFAGDYGTDALYAVTSFGSGLLVGGAKHDFSGQPNAAFVRTDTFGHGSCATAAGCIDKSALDCDDGKPCTLDGCEQGACKSQPSTYALPCDKGAGYCAGDICKSAPVSCLALRDAVPDNASGVFKLDPDGPTGPVAPFTAWCDQTNDGGGWTLVLKAAPATQTFLYDSPQWLSPSPFAADQPAYDTTEAKLSSYSSLPLKELRVGLRSGGVVRSLSFDAVGPSLLALMTTKVKSALDTKWLDLTPGMQKPWVYKTYVAEGVPDPYLQIKVRIGIQVSHPAGFTTNTTIGLGCWTNSLSNPDAMPVGGYSNFDSPGTAVPAFGYVWAR